MNFIYHDDVIQDMKAAARKGSTFDTIHTPATKKSWGSSDNAAGSPVVSVPPSAATSTSTNTTTSTTHSNTHISANTDTDITARLPPLQSQSHREGTCHTIQNNISNREHTLETTPTSLLQSNNWEPNSTIHTTNISAVPRSNHISMTEGSSAPTPSESMDIFRPLNTATKTTIATPSTSSNQNPIDSMNPDPFVYDVDLQHSLRPGYHKNGLHYFKNESRPGTGAGAGQLQSQNLYHILGKGWRSDMTEDNSDSTREGITAPHYSSNRFLQSRHFPFSAVGVAFARVSAPITATTQYHHEQEYRQEYRQQEPHYPDRHASANRLDYLHTRDCHETFHDRDCKVNEDHYNHDSYDQYHNRYQQQQHSPRGHPELHQHQNLYSSIYTHPREQAFTSSLNEYGIGSRIGFRTGWRQHRPCPPFYDGNVEYDHPQQQHQQHQQHQQQYSQGRSRHDFAHGERRYYPQQKQSQGQSQSHSPFFARNNCQGNNHPDGNRVHTSTHANIHGARGGGSITGASDNNIITEAQREAERENRFYQRFGTNREYHHVEEHVNDDAHDHMEVEMEMDADRKNRFYQQFGMEKENPHVDDHVEDHPHGFDHGKVEIDHIDAERENRFHQRFGKNREYHHTEEQAPTCSVADERTKEGEEASMSNDHAMSNDHGLEDGKVQRTAPTTSLTVENCWNRTPAIPTLRPRTVSNDVEIPSGTFTAEKQQQNVLQYVNDKRAEKSNFSKVCVCHVERMESSIVNG